MQCCQLSQIIRENLIGFRVFCVITNSVTIGVSEYFLRKWHHVMSHMMSFIIPFLSILSIWRRRGLTAMSKYYMVIIKRDMQLSQPVKLATKHWWSHFSALSWKVIVRIKNEIMAIKLIGWSILEKWLKRLFLLFRRDTWSVGGIIL